MRVEELEALSVRHASAPVNRPPLNMVSIHILVGHGIRMPCDYMALEIPIISRVPFPMILMHSGTRTVWERDKVTQSRWLTWDQSLLTK